MIAIAAIVCVASINDVHTSVQSAVVTAGENRYGPSLYTGPPQPPGRLPHRFSGFTGRIQIILVELARCAPFLAGTRCAAIGHMR
jgi:hypothetical protein